MEGLRTESSFCSYVADRLGAERFTLVDIGCSGGIAPIWRLFASRLCAVGFDPVVEEVNRLNAAETLADVRYIAGHVGLPADNPITRRRGQRPFVQRSPWARFSSFRTAKLRAARTRTKANGDTTKERLPNPSALADASPPIVLPEFFRANAIDDIDFIKIDVDGPDFDILQSLTDSIRDLNVLGLGLEVNFYGSHEETDHSFHNTDRLMRLLGFDLFNLTVRPYSVAALPARYQLTIPAQTAFGRPAQGDALYCRDLGDPARVDEADGMHVAKLVKSATIYACFGLFDCAAEVLLTHSARLQPMLDIASSLDLLCADCQAGSESHKSYQNYIAAFENDNPMFYPKLGDTSD